MGLEDPSGTLFVEQAPNEKSDFSPVIVLWENLIANVIPNNNDQPATFNLEEVIKNLNLYVAARFGAAENVLETTAEEKDELSKLVTGIYPQIIQTFVDAGVLPDNCKSQLDRIINQDDLHVEQGTSAGQFIHLSDEFPKTSAEHGVIIIRTGIKDRVKLLTKQLNDNNIDLPTSDISEIVVWYVLSHELGHAISKTISLRIGELKSTQVGVIQKEIEDDIHNNIAPDGEIDLIIDEEAEYLRRIAKDKMEKLRASFKEAEIPDEEIDGILEGEDRIDEICRGSMIQERIASGFELIGLREILLKKGLQQSEVELILSLDQAERQKYFNQFKKFISDSRAKGWTIDQLERLFESISIALDEKDDLLDLFPEFGFNVIGYEKPLTHDELMQFVGKYFN